MEISLSVSEKKLLYDSAILLMGTYMKASKSAYNRHACTPMFIAALFTMAK
jgi:hypothetical protein